jgi:membrane fusion protein
LIVLKTIIESLLIMNTQSLFRTEALDHAKNKQMGDVFINTPGHYWVLVVGCGVFVLCLMVFITCAEFSEKCRVKGYINSEQGMVHAYAKRQGVIVKCLVAQGDLVKQGAALFLIDSSYDGLVSTEQRQTLQPLLHKKRALLKEITYKRRQLDRLKPLLRKKYISLTDYHMKQEEIVALENQKHGFALELLRYKQSRAYTVRAPIDGIVSSVMRHVGQQVVPGKPLLSLLPNHARWIAELYVPVEKAGFMKKNAPLMIHYDAYPYQRFGAVRGRIQAMSQTILTDAEEDKPIKINQPYYKVTACLANQDVMVYGKSRPLQQGMTLSVIMMGAKKKVWQWMLDPLYSYSQEHLA